MSKQLLSCLSLCLLGFTAQAQWVNQPIGFAPNNAPFYIDAIDANTAWTVGNGFLTGAYAQPQVARTVNAGQTWTVTNLPVQTSAEEDFTALSAISASMAWVTTTVGGAGGRILKTTDGGLTWTTQSGPTVYGNSNSYPDLIHFFSATDGVTVGDAVNPSSPLEIFTTTNGGLTWTPVTNSPVAMRNEFPVATPPAVVGNHIWFVTQQGRVYHSPDKGLTWTVAAVGNGLMSGTSLVFRDLQNGLLCSLDDTGTSHELYRTTDGGATWGSIAYNGPLHGLGLSTVPGSNLYVSTGSDIGNGDQGSSYSRDNGQTWVSLESTLNHITTEFVSPAVGWSTSFSLTAGQLVGGANRFSGTLLATRPDAALQASLSVAPNPALGGLFTLQTACPGGSGAATVRILDVAGRLVQQRTWAGTAPLAFDLSQEPAGLYVLEVQAASGTARQKVVVQ